MDLSFKRDWGGGAEGEWHEALVSKDFCCQVWGPKFDPGYHIGRREITYKSCSLTYTRTHTLIINLKTVKKTELEVSCVLFCGAMLGLNHGPCYTSKCSEAKWQAVETELRKPLQSSGTFRTMYFPIGWLLGSQPYVMDTKYSENTLGHKMSVNFHILL